MQKYRFVIMLGLLPLFVLTIFSFVPVFTSPGTDSPSDVPDTTGPKEVARQAHKRAATDENVDKRLDEFIIRPFRTGGVSPRMEAGERTKPALDAWKDLVDSRDLLRRISESLQGEPDEPPAEVPIPRHVNSIPEVERFIPDLEGEILDLDDWLSSEQQRLTGLNSSKNVILNAGRLKGTSGILKIISARIRYLQPQIDKVKSNRDKLEVARENFVNVVQNLETAQEAFGRRDYPAAIQVLGECSGPIPPEVNKLVMKAKFWRDSEKVLAHAESVSQMPRPTKEWPNWLGDLEQLITQAKKMNALEDHELSNRLDSLVEMRDLIDGKMRVNSIEGLILALWVREAKQIVGQFDNDSVAKTVRMKIKKEVQRTLAERLTKEADKLEKRTSSYKNLMQALHENDTVIIGVFAMHRRGAYYKYWTTPDARRKEPGNPETVHVDILKERPGEPTPVRCAAEYNVQLISLQADPLSLDRWEQFKDTSEQIEVRLANFAKRGGPPDPKLNLSRDIEISGQIVTLKHVIAELLGRHPALTSTSQTQSFSKRSSHFEVLGS